MFFAAEPQKDNIKTYVLSLENYYSGIEKTESSQSKNQSTEVKIKLNSSLKQNVIYSYTDLVRDVSFKFRLSVLDHPNFFIDPNNDSNLVCTREITLEDITANNISIDYINGQVLDIPLSQLTSDHYTFPSLGLLKQQNSEERGDFIVKLNIPNSSVSKALIQFLKDNDFSYDWIASIQVPIQDNLENENLHLFTLQNLLLEKKKFLENKEQLLHQIQDSLQ
ncbi:hypothetical protein EDI_260750 [Entamoeba dispar SAW760]|uniref:Uncharacterized protein n=1 Tax=Entamoeba dispar (strain ATCC PRA-260 / SAW760) TaxID=370354 RepID=B0EIW1_ENTDS|nr:uncharacterized protein EDI_260750 [Entamoeba dispar SAW760]EDR25529.1 hypothetical protein EDI_260750 [Entamoeba dispar SAW760]|eukprot:EDR25529.1 hypothetical protein EDI_260750 [Entamoeba dispar SAW760]